MIPIVVEDDLAVVVAIDGVEGQDIVIWPKWSSHPRQVARSDGRLQGKTELTLGFLLGGGFGHSHWILETDEVKP